MFLGTTLAVALAAVPRPWTPVTVDGGQIGVWGRTYGFASNALPTAVTSAGGDLLAGPMRIVCADAKGESIVWRSPCVRIARPCSTIFRHRGQSSRMRAA
ncbi:MAG TPA: hypothetical protein P5026_05865 [Kiritimatiellia bacterium]|nr:hypothetical protein [Kiritimatiellia bacterium]